MRSKWLKSVVATQNFNPWISLENKTRHSFPLLETLRHKDIYNPNMGVLGKKKKKEMSGPFFSWRYASGLGKVKFLVWGNLTGSSTSMFLYLSWENKIRGNTGSGREVQEEPQADAISVSMHSNKYNM